MHCDKGNIMIARHPPITGCGGVFKKTGCIRRDVIEIKYINVNYKYNKNIRCPNCSPTIIKPWSLQNFLIEI